MLLGYTPTLINGFAGGKWPATASLESGLGKVILKGGEKDHYICTACDAHRVLHACASPPPLHIWRHLQIVFLLFEVVLAFYSYN